MTLKKTAQGLFVLIFLLTIEAQSEVLRWPQLCLKGMLTVQNWAATPTPAWLQKFSPGGRVETPITLPARGQIVVELNSPDDFTRYTLMHFNPNQVWARFECAPSPGIHGPTQSLEGGVMTFQRSDVNENKLWLQNLFSGDNQVTMQFLNEADEVVQQDTLTLPSLEQKSFKDLLPNGSWSHVKVFADNRFTAFNLTSHGAGLPQNVEVQKSSVDQNASYFVVGPRTGAGDSFIVRITDAAMIARARDLVLHPEYEKIVFGRIVKGHQGFNRNWSKSEKSFWSWSVDEVTNFADLGSTACNGIPQQVEDGIDAWLQDPGRICFWNYRIKSELTPAQVAGEN